MENINTRLEELFSKTQWTTEECEWFLELLRLKSPAELQQYFQEDYLSSLFKEQPADIHHAETLLQQIHQKAGIQPQQAPVVQITSRKNWWRVAAAAIGIIAIVGVGYLFIPKNNKQEAQSIGRNHRPANDVSAPTSSRAMITLANGDKVFLDSINKGQLAQEDDVKLVKLATGEVIYKAGNGEALKETRYNTLSNPKGSKVATIVLSDGTRAWLNAGSSLTYPVSFIDNDRKVSVSGEVYFEVTSLLAEGKKRPFIVQTNHTTIEVLGTHFNVNSYEDEPEAKITLLEGSVRIRRNSETKLLKPGEQAQVSSIIKVVDDINEEEVMAWKNGFFQFAGADVEEVMRQLARWYDVEIVYEGKPAEQHFRGGIPRDVEVSKVFEMLETTGAVRFRIEGKRIIVRP
ncbi:FecR domain-containing protein [Chitinophagaceae bacterium 26-R-25]|nr:FecR domain-containing protein [Chitinophagaceae bacterium 26-R-25]